MIWDLTVCTVVNGEKNSKSHCHPDLDRKIPNVELIRAIYILQYFQVLSGWNHYFLSYYYYLPWWPSCLDRGALNNVEAPGCGTSVVRGPTGHK